MVLRSLIAMVALVSISGCGQPDLPLISPPGEFRTHDIGAKSAQSSVSVTVVLTTFDRHSEWPPAAYVGFYEGEDRNSSVQFVLIQNNASDDYLVAGYRVIESGEETNVVALDTIKVGDPVEVSMTFADGLTTIVLKGGPTRQERTKLKLVTPYVSVSSGTATFELAT